MVFNNLIAVISVLFAAYEIFNSIYSRKEVRRRWYFEKMSQLRKNGVSSEFINEKIRELISQSKGVGYYLIINNLYWLFLVVALFTPMRLYAIYIMVQSFLFGRMLRQCTEPEEVDTKNMVYLNTFDHQLSAFVLIVGVSNML